MVEISNPDNTCTISSDLKRMRDDFLNNKVVFEEYLKLRKINGENISGEQINACQNQIAGLLETNETNETNETKETNEQVGGSISKVTIHGKQYTVYVKIKGEFMTVRQATKVLSAAQRKRK